MQMFALSHGAGLAPQLPLRHARLLSSGPAAHPVARQAGSSACPQPRGGQWPSRPPAHASFSSPLLHSQTASQRCRAVKPDGESSSSDPGAASKGDEQGENDAVTAVSNFLGRAAQTPLWFLLLFVTLLATFGGYGYLIVTNIEDSNVPILVGPKGTQQQPQQQAPSIQQ